MPMRHRLHSPLTCIRLPHFGGVGCHVIYNFIFQFYLFFLYFLIFLIFYFFEIFLISELNSLNSSGHLYLSISYPFVVMNLSKNIGFWPFGLIILPQIY